MPPLKKTSSEFNLRSAIDDIEEERLNEIKASTPRDGTVDSKENLDSLEHSVDKLFLGGSFCPEQDAFLEKTFKIGLDFHKHKTVRNAALKIPEHIGFTQPPVSGHSFDYLISEFESLAAESTRFNSPQFMGFPDSGNCASAVAAGILAPFINQNLINQEFCAPKATFLEMETIHWMRSLLGFPVLQQYENARQIGGCAVMGGVGANTTALLAAREKMDPGSLANGLSVAPRKVKILAPAGISHYSIRTSLGWLGLGENSIVPVKIDADFKMDLFDLENVIERERRQGNSIMAGVAYAGDSRTMSIDSLDKIADIFQKNKIWFHVDACHGMQLLFSHKYKYRLKGISKADSVTVDPHKVLWIPYTLSYILFKDLSALDAIATSSDLITKEKWSLGQTTPFVGSKAFNSFKLWAVMKSLGTQRIGDLIDQRIDLSYKIQDLVEKSLNLRLLNRSDINSTMFIWHDADNYLTKEDLNAINRAIKRTIQSAGEFYVHGFPIVCSDAAAPHAQTNAIDVLRIMNGNPRSTIQDARALLTHIEKIGGRLSSAFQRINSFCASDEKKKTVLKQLAEEAVSKFGDDIRDVIVYGSGAYEGKDLSSDLDVMVFLNNDLNIQRMRDFSITMQRLHVDHGLRIDEEVPYENKLVITSADLSASLRGEGFKWNGGRMIVPQVVKSSTFLSSPSIRYRLIVNILTSPTFGLFGESFEKESQDAFDLLVDGLIGDQWVDMKDDEIYAILLGQPPLNGEMFLGYKDTVHVRTRLVDLLNEKVQRRGGYEHAA